MPARDGGFVTVQYVAVASLSLLFVVAMVNLVVFQYGRGVVRAAVDEGVRAGARSRAAVAECHDRANDVLGDLLGGAMGAGVTVRCDQAGEMLQVTADVVFAGWLPAVPDWRFRVEASTPWEHSP